MLVTVAGGTEIPLELTRQLKGCGLSRGTTYAPLSTASALQRQTDYPKKLTKHKDLEGGFVLTHAHSSGEPLALRGPQDHSVGESPPDDDEWSRNLHPIPPCHRNYSCIDYPPGLLVYACHFFSTPLGALELSARRPSCRSSPRSPPPAASLFSSCLYASFVSKA
ncbi:hypothetical protein B0H65DRAFT_578572 [Neurospora tetraspora]|uniref:Uncharacterized protein n=1 Tax=Neurospora tetraspora TaxID=94610 RepID=A0AAE0JBN2_9PEZI|nr:hypothetical protein B0H65DRAFT_578572 [Neurospora tetraspora]